MSFLDMGFLPKKDAIGRKSASREITEMSDGGSLVVEVNGEESATDFWPIQHPVEPPQKPVECPLPHSSLINHEWRLSRSFHSGVAAEPTSKRRHSVSHVGEYSYKGSFFHDK